MANLAPGEMKKMWREAAGSGYEGSFASFADTFNKLVKQQPAGQDAIVDTAPFDETNRPDLKILGMNPWVFGGTLVGSLLLIGFGLKVIFSNKKRE